jgi:hypothetical protein
LAETVLVLDDDYALTGAGTPAGGTRTAITPPATGTTRYITVDPAKTQEAVNPGAAATEDALDKLTQIIQQMQLEVDRSIKLPEADRLAGSVATTIAAGLAANRAFTYFGFDENGAIGARDIFGSPSPIASSTTYDPATHFGRHLLLDVSSGDVALTLPDAATIKDGAGFWVRANSNSNTPSITVAETGQMRSRPMNGVTGHVTDADTIYIGYHASAQTSAYAYVWKDTTTGATTSVWQVAGLIRDDVADDNRITPGGGVVDSVVGQTGDVTGNQIKTEIDALADTNFLTDAERTKLAGIETAATADQTGSEIKALYEALADTNAFTDAEQTKLAGVETAATADQSDAEIETAYNNQVSAVGQAEAEAGTATTVRRWTAERVAQAIAALAGDGQTAAEVPVAATPTNYAAATADVEAHLAGVDNKFGNLVSVTSVTTHQEDIPEILDGDDYAFSVTVTGAALGEAFMVAPTVDIGDLSISQKVIAADTLEVVLSNLSDGTIAAQNDIDFNVYPIASAVVAAGTELAAVGEGAVIVENAAGQHVGQLQPVGIDLSFPGVVENRVDELKLRIGATFSSIDVIVSAGSLVLTIAIDGTAIDEVDGITVNQTTRTNIELTGNNVGAAEDYMTITIASVSSAADFRLNINGLRTAFAAS